MISRKTTMELANAYVEKFTYWKYSSPSKKYNYYVSNNDLYDFLYEREYESWFCNLVYNIYGKRGLQEWILKIHTGETLYEATKNWSCENRVRLGQEYLKYLSRDFLNWYLEQKDDKIVSRYHNLEKTLIRRLEIDGYDHRNGELREMEVEVLDVEAEMGLLETLYSGLGLGNQKQAFCFLSLSEDHYIAGRWSDAIVNSRKFLESVLQETAVKYSMSRKGSSIPQASLSRAIEVRQYLEKEELLEKKERETVDKIYGLLSHTGGHPYMAEKDQARLLRQLSLTVAQFIMLRLDGAMKTP